MLAPRPTTISARRRQRGSFLLEALVAVLVISLGIMGLVGLQARAMQNVDDAQFRGEAAFLASDVLGRMWSTDQATLEAQFNTGGGVGTPYDEFKNVVHARLPGASAIAGNPDVVVTPRFGSIVNGYDVVITVRWKPPGEAAGSPSHNFVTSAVVKLN